MTAFKEVGKIDVNFGDNTLKIVPIMLDFNKVIYFESTFYFGQEYVMAYLSNGEKIDLDCKFEDFK